MSGISSGAGSGITNSEKIAATGLTAFGEYAVAQNQAAFLAHFPYNINPRIVNTTLVSAGTITQSNQLGVVSSGAATSSSAILETLDVLEYHPGMGGLFRGTAIFDTPKAGNIQYIGIGDSLDGFFFGYSGTDFGIVRRSGGVDNFIPKSSWNADKFDGTGKSGVTLNPQTGNVFQIKYQWLGFGAIRFYLENPATGTFEICHIIKYSNANTSVSVNNPTFPGCAISSNTTNDTDVVLRVGCLAGYIEGIPSNVGYIRNAFRTSKTVAATLIPVFTLRTRTTYEGVTNRVRIVPDLLDIATDGTKTVIVDALLNATLTGASYTDISTNTSVAEVDTAATAVSGGILIASFVVQKVGDESVLFRDYNTILQPGSAVTFAATSVNTNDIGIALSWEERFT